MHLLVTELPLRNAARGALLRVWGREVGGGGLRRIAGIAVATAVDGDRPRVSAGVLTVARRGLEAGRGVTERSSVTRMNEEARMSFSLATWRPGPLAPFFSPYNRQCFSIFTHWTLRVLPIVPMLRKRKSLCRFP